MTLKRYIGSSSVRILDVEKHVLSAALSVIRLFIVGDTEGKLEGNHYDRRSCREEDEGLRGDQATSEAGEEAPSFSHRAHEDEVRAECTQKREKQVPLGPKVSAKFADRGIAMGYMHIDNLYKRPELLTTFKELYALEKVHGTSAHVSWNEGRLGFFAGGASHEHFVGIFDHDKLTSLFQSLGHDKVLVFGEAYGGKLQGMRETYGPNLKFVAFDVQVGDVWLDVPNAADVVAKLGLEFVFYERIEANLSTVDSARDRDSEQAIRNGMGSGHKAEGVVLRPLIEMIRSNGVRVMAKHKRDEFMETKTPRKVDETKLAVLEEAQAIATEWVTDERLRHVLDKLPQGISIEGTSQVIAAMKEDVYREAKDEIVESRAADGAIAKATALLFKKHLKKALGV